MRKVLFIGVTKFDFQKFFPSHLQRKYLGLSKGIRPYILGRGRPFHKIVWGTEFYLLPANFLFWPLAFFLAFYLCWIKKIDTIVAQSPLIEGVVGAILKKIFKKELIVEIHGDWLEGPFLSKKRRLAFLLKKIVPVLAIISLRNADKIRAVAEYLLARAKEIAPAKPYFVFPTFTDLDSFLKEQNAELEKFVLFVGRAEEVKGVKYLVEAFSQIKNDFPDFRLVLVGEGLPEGKLPLDEVRNRIKSCYCLVVPSLSEGLPRVVLEAMALGKAVIASKVGGIPEVIEDGKTGFLFEKGNSVALAEKLRVLLSDKELAMSIGKRAKEFVSARFSNEKYIENYLKMINNK